MKHLPLAAAPAKHADATETLVSQLAAALLARGERVATAESCTGGLIAAVCTALAGSSVWFEQGVVSYSNEAKTSLLGVPPALIAAHGAVSAEVARAMVQGVLQPRAGLAARAHWAVAVTGIAGPSGGSPAKPVGTVWLAWAGPGLPVQTQLLQLPGDRASVRSQTVQQALQALLSAMAPHAASQSG